MNSNLNHFQQLLLLILMEKAKTAPRVQKLGYKGGRAPQQIFCDIFERVSVKNLEIFPDIFIKTLKLFFLS